MKSKKYVCMGCFTVTDKKEVCCTNNRNEPYTVKRYYGRAPIGENEAYCRNEDYWNMLQEHRNYGH